MRCPIGRDPVRSLDSLRKRLQRRPTVRRSARSAHACSAGCIPNRGWAPVPAPPARSTKRGERMLGTITQFSKLTTSGAIRSEAGRKLRFRPRRSIDLRCRRARRREIRPLPSRRPLRPAKPSTFRSNPPPRFTPAPIDTKKSRSFATSGSGTWKTVRHFRFERITPGAPTQSFEVTANLALIPHLAYRAFRKGRHCACA